MVKISNTFFMSINASTPQPALALRDVSKTYRAAGGAPPAHALKGVSLQIRQGEIYGLLGPNGAGKSTCINILGGMVDKSAGRVCVWGFDLDKRPRQVRALIGIVPQELQIDPFFTPEEILDLQAGLYGIAPAERRTYEILDALGLADKADAYVRTLSGGMRRRLMVAKAMVHYPPILVLDEPTAGVDIELRRQLWAYVRRLNEAGATILLTTHYLEEAESLCGRVGIIDKGELVAEDETQRLLERVEGNRLRMRLGFALDEVPQAIAALPQSQTHLFDAGKGLEIHYRPRRLKVGQILAACQEAELEIVDLTIHKGSLEDVFLRLTGDSTPVLPDGQKGAGI